ncbi:LOW QUALITY PROTEIN: hypothetical protein V2J09_007822 [Rumex salicifolius]
MAPIMQQFREIETCIECSAYKIYRSYRASTMLRKQSFILRIPSFIRKLKLYAPDVLRRIFILCDHDRDGALSDAELNDLQVKCFNAPLQPAEIIGVKRVVQEKLPEGVNERGLTLTGFLFLHALFIEKGRLETTWTFTVLELTKNAIEYLKDIFRSYDIHDALRPWDLNDELFSIAPESPWSEDPYKDAAATTALGGTSVEGFLSNWALMTLLDPAKSVEYLRYLMYDGDVSSAIRVTRKRHRSNVFQCFVFGPKGAGKTALLNAFLGRPFSERYTSITEEQYSGGFVDEPVGAEKVLVLREILEDSIPKLLSSKNSLAPCDVAIFVYDSSDDMSWRKTSDLLVDVASHGEDSGYEMPCLILSAKDDLETFPLAIPDPAQVSQDMGIDSPIPISAKLGEFNNVFRRIVCAIPPACEPLPHVGAVVTVVGLAAFRKQMMS